jgi:hypothetical protein
MKKSNDETIEIRFFKLHGRAAGVDSISVFEKLMTHGMRLATLVAVCGIAGSLVMVLVR